MDEQPNRLPVFPISGYVALNLVAWAVMALATAVMGWMVGDWQSLAGFFLVLAGAFTLVSIYDALYDRLARRAASPPPSS